MSALTVIQAPDMTMTSKEMADLTEKRHDNVSAPSKPLQIKELSPSLKLRTGRKRPMA